LIKNIDDRAYNEQLYNKGDMPRIRIVYPSVKTNKSKSSAVIIAPPMDYDELMKRIPYSKLITNDVIKAYLANKYNADYTCPVSSRKFIVLAAFASAERGIDETPYWRTLKKDGELNDKYPGGIDEQKRLLEKEGHTITQVGKRYYVKDYRQRIFDLNS